MQPNQDPNHQRPPPPYANQQAVVDQQQQHQQQQYTDFQQQHQHQQYIHQQPPPHLQQQQEVSQGGLTPEQQYQQQQRAMFHQQWQQQQQQTHEQQQFYQQPTQQPQPQHQYPHNQQSQQHTVPSTGEVGGHPGQQHNPHQAIPQQYHYNPPQQTQLPTHQQRGHQQSYPAVPLNPTSQSLDYRGAPLYHQPQHHAPQQPQHAKGPHHVLTSQHQRNTPPQGGGQNSSGSSPAGPPPYADLSSDASSLGSRTPLHTPRGGISSAGGGRGSSASGRGSGARERSKLGASQEGIQTSKHLPKHLQYLAESTSPALRLVADLLKSSDDTQIRARLFTPNPVAGAAPTPNDSFYLLLSALLQNEPAAPSAAGGSHMEPQQQETLLHKLMNFNTDGDSKGGKLVAIALEWADGVAKAEEEAAAAKKAEDDAAEATASSTFPLSQQAPTTSPLPSAGSTATPTSTSSTTASVGAGPALPQRQWNHHHLHQRVYELLQSNQCDKYLMTYGCKDIITLCSSSPKFFGAVRAVLFESSQSFEKYAKNSHSTNLIRDSFTFATTNTENGVPAPSVWNPATLALSTPDVLERIARDKPGSYVCQDWFRKCDMAYMHNLFRILLSSVPPMEAPEEGGGAASVHNCLLFRLSNCPFGNYPLQTALERLHREVDLADHRHGIHSSSAVHVGLELSSEDEGERQHRIQELLRELQMVLPPAIIGATYKPQVLKALNKE